ncbi:hypothetical protein MAR_023990, partial [Mya arenaria]
MDFNRWFWINLLTVFGSLIASGFSESVWPSEYDSDHSEPDLLQKYNNDNTWDTPNTGENYPSLLSLLKRGGMGVPLEDEYQRFPRIKDRVIIPFFSYGSNLGYGRPRISAAYRPQVQIGYSPWNKIQTDIM